MLTRTATLLVCLALFLVGCGRPSDSTGPATQEPAGSIPAEPPVDPPAPGTVTRGDGSTNLDTTPLSAADYAMYAAIMGGASAMLSTLTPAEKDALVFANKVEAGTARATPATEPLLAQARALRQKDVELARLQGIEDRYLKVKGRVEAVIGPNATSPSADDTLARENLRYLEAHRQTIERLQGILRDPLSRPAEAH